MDEIVDNLGRRHPVRQHEFKARQQAMAAGRFAIANNINRDEVAAQFKVTPSGVSLAIVILKYGTEEEIAAVESGMTGLRPTYDLVAKRVPREKRVGKSVAISRDRAEQSKTDAASWRELKAALDAICGLPQPADMVRIARRNGVRTASVDRDIMTAFSWLTEFSDAWTK